MYLNGTRLPVNGFKAYVEQYMKDKTDDSGEPLKVIYEEVARSLLPTHPSYPHPP